MVVGDGERSPNIPAGSRSATLAVLSVAQFTTTLEFSIVYLALPSIAADLRLDAASAQWVVSAYAVLFAGFLIVGGRLSDRFGARRLFIVAVVTFGVASAIGGAAGDGTVLLAARGTQGFGAALLQPAALGLLQATFPAGRSRGAAVSIWSSVGASGLAAGAVLGGLLTSTSWRLTFAINVPLTLGCALGAAAWIGSARSRTPGGRIPMLASVLGTGTVLVLVLGLTLASDVGWTAAPTFGCIGIALLLFLGFAGNENTAGAVLIEPTLRRIPSLRIAAGVSALYMASVGSEFYLLTLLLQTALGYRPLAAGLAFLPLAVLVIAGSATAGRAARTYDPATVLLGGFGAATLGLAWLALTPYGDADALQLLPGLILSGFGNGVVFTSMFVIGTHHVPPAHRGIAGALLTTSQYVSGALTVAILTLALGPAPDHASFRVAFLIATAAAAAGVLLVASRHRRLVLG
ncbi:MAG: MFS transporter [Pseudonocardiaceae bacterium]|nr:MFS transporter [Pseudonocardiaceae bacterium]